MASSTPEGLNDALLQQNLERLALSIHTAARYRIASDPSTSHLADILDRLEDNELTEMAEDRREATLGVACRNRLSSFAKQLIERNVAAQLRFARGIYLAELENARQAPDAKRENGDAPA